MNSEFRVKHLEEVNLELGEYEKKIACEAMSADEVYECNTLMTSIKENFLLESKFEDALIENYSFDDVLVIIEDDLIDVRIYIDLDVKKDAVGIMKLVSEHFDSYRKVKVTPVSKTE